MSTTDTTGWAPIRAELERVAWSRIHRDFKGTLDGERTILELLPGKGTCIVLLREASDQKLWESIRETDRQALIARWGRS